MGAYGYNIEHILMVDIIPDPSVRAAMNEINAGAYFLLCLYFRAVQNVNFFEHPVLDVALQFLFPNLIK